MQACGLSTKVDEIDKLMGKIV